MPPLLFSPKIDKELLIDWHINVARWCHWSIETIGLNTWHIFSFVPLIDWLKNHISNINSVDPNLGSWPHPNSFSGMQKSCLTALFYVGRYHLFCQTSKSLFGSAFSPRMMFNLWCWHTGFTLGARDSVEAKYADLYYTPDQEDGFLHQIAASLYNENHDQWSFQ